MKKVIFILAIMALGAIGAKAQTKKDGTPDMRYKANKEIYGNSYSSPTFSTPKSSSFQTAPNTERNYRDGGQYKIQNGYMKSNGTYVSPHIKTTPDNNIYNNIKQKKQ